MNKKLKEENEELKSYITDLQVEMSKYREQRDIAVNVLDAERNKQQECKQKLEQLESSYYMLVDKYHMVQLECWQHNLNAEMETDSANNE